MKEILKTTPPQLLAILFIVLSLMAYGSYLSKVAQERCIQGAIGVAKKEARANGSEFYAMPGEVIRFCKETF